MMIKQQGRLDSVSLYIHIPFCVRKCRYCDFLSAPCGETERERYVLALIREIRSRGEECTGRRVRSVFFGGGTPSLLSPDQFERIAAALKSAFPEWEANCEWTVEANPGTVSVEKAQMWKSCGVNRVSMGMQSADPEMLKVLGRIHSMGEVRESVTMLRQCGFENINLDLMMGLPGQSRKSWKKTMEEAVSLHPKHLSCYSLIIEEGTPISEDLASGRLQEIDEELDRAMYEDTLVYLQEQGYRQYEISNFSLPGFESMHNMGYWDLSEYIGIGLGASSLFAGRRRKNTDLLEAYCSAEDPALLQVEEEVMDEKNSMEEWAFLGLRKTMGIRRQDFQERFGLSLDSVYEKPLRKLLQNGLIEDDGSRIFLSRRGLDLANQVFEAFLLD